MFGKSLKEAFKRKDTSEHSTCFKTIYLNLYKVDSSIIFFFSLLFPSYSSLLRLQVYPNVKSKYLVYPPKHQKYVWKHKILFNIIKKSTTNYYNKLFNFTSDAVMMIEQFILK